MNMTFIAALVAARVSAAELYPNNPLLAEAEALRSLREEFPLEVERIKAEYAAEDR